MKRPFSLPPARSFRLGSHTVLLALLLAMGLVFGVFSFAPAAQAASDSHAQATVPYGSNGQQLLLETHRAFSVYVEGYNQNNEYVAHCFHTPQIYTLTTGWWWKATENSWVYTSSFASTDCSGKILSSSVVGECFIGWDVPAQYPGDTYVIDLDRYNC